MKLGISLKLLAEKLVVLEPSVSRLAGSCCLGICVAVSPFLGIQTWIALPLAWLLGLNAKVVVAVLWTINNPLTMVPFVIVNYAFGHFIIEQCLAINLVQFNPPIMEWVNEKIGPTIAHYLGISHLCFWCYILGGLILCMACSWPWYFLLKRWFSQFLDKHL